MSELNPTERGEKSYLGVCVAVWYGWLAKREEKISEQTDNVDA